MENDPQDKHFGWGGSLRAHRLYVHAFGGRRTARPASLVLLFTNRKVPVFRVFHGYSSTAGSCPCLNMECADMAALFYDATRRVVSMISGDLVPFVRYPDDQPFG